MSWEPTETMARRAKAMTDANAALASEDWTTASERFAEVLLTEPDADTRVQAIAGLKAARRELSRAASDTWQTAVMATALGEADAEAWDAVKRIDPLNPSATLRDP